MTVPSTAQPTPGLACQEGTTVRYDRYRDHFSPRAGVSVHWSWASIAQALASAPQAERGSLTLSSTGTAPGCELIPGIAINVQIVLRGTSTRSHSHSWWHLFFVRSGCARAVMGSGDIRRLNAGDLLLVPAWNDHRFENDGDDDLVLLSMSNLPHQAALANHLAQEPVDSNAT